MRVAAVQFDFDENEPFDARVDRMISLISAAATDSDLVVLPELWPNGGFTYRLWEPTAQPLDGPLVKSLQDAARSASTTLLHAVR